MVNETIGDTMSITSSILKATQTSIDRLFSDSNLCKEIIYKQFQGSAYVPELAYNTETFINYSISGIYVEKEKLSFPIPNASPIVGIEAAFLFRFEDLPDSLDKRDFIQHNGSSYAIEKITPILNLAYRIVVRGSET